MSLSQVKSNIYESNSSHFKFIIIAICSLINMMMALGTLFIAPFADKVGKKLMLLTLTIETIYGAGFRYIAFNPF